MEVLRLVNKALSDDDIRRILGRDIKILKYSDLDEFRDLDELLPNPTDYCIILYEDRPGRGHWTGLLKYDGLFEHFDSYGNKVDAPLRWINMKQRRLLDQAEPSLSRLLAHEHFMYNHVEYQNKDSSVNTCGSHVCHRIYRLKHDGMDLPTYHQFMQGIKEETDVGYDLIVAEWVRKFLG